MTAAAGTQAHAETFSAFRPLLFTIAYEILGSSTDAEDVLQDCYLRWAGVDRDTVRDEKAYLARMVTRQSLNALRSAARRREDYVGPWLPEPILLAEDATADLLLAESVSVAMLIVLETLGPDERAVFVLREVFSFDYAEIAATMDRSVEAVRQIAHRARSHVHARRRRFAPLPAAETTELLAGFRYATATGDVEQLIGLLSPDVAWTADSDGKASAARRPVVGAEKVAAFILGLFRIGGTDARAESAVFNGAPAMVLYLGDHLEGVVTLEIAEGVITHFYAMRNPEKLAGIAIPRRVAR